MGCIFSCWEKQEEKSINYGECVICLELMNSDLTALPCAHVFHHKCIGGWLYRKPTCPVCSMCIYV